MGALQSIPFCSREKQKEGGGDVPPLQLDNNNNEAAVVADQPAAVAQTPATVRGNLIILKEHKEESNFSI